MPDSLSAWLALNRTPGIGPVRGAALLARYPEPEQIFNLARSELNSLSLPDSALQWLAKPDWSLVEQDLQWLAGADRHVITLADTDYPALLRQIDDPPLLLFVQGNRSLPGQHQLAIVGSRNPGAGAEATTRDFASGLSGAGLIITSGLASGIDAAAHRGALDAGGATIAVTGTGLDRVYPARHRDLAHAIAERGALVSEYAIGTPPSAGHFPRRNRIISGLSLGTLVVEAAIQSGSLITARLAGEQGREVFAMPGSIHNPLAKGCHRLIRQGAKLVETCNDIIEDLGPLAHFQAQADTFTEVGEQSETGLDEDYRDLLEALGWEPVSVDSVVQRTGLTADVVCSMLLMLELQGHISTQPGGFYVRTAPIKSYER